MQQCVFCLTPADDEYRLVTTDRVQVDVLCRECARGLIRNHGGATCTHCDTDDPQFAVQGPTVVNEYGDGVDPDVHNPDPIPVLCDSCADLYAGSVGQLPWRP